MKGREREREREKGDRKSEVGKKVTRKAMFPVVVSLIKISGPKIGLYIFVLPGKLRPASIHCRKIHFFLTYLINNYTVIMDDTDSYVKAIFVSNSARKNYVFSN